MEYKKNADGTDMLDEQGNPIPAENTDKENESDSVKEQKEINKALVEELKEIREERRILKDIAEKKLQDTTPPAKTPDSLTEEEKITLAVNKVLQAKESSNAQANKIAAFEKYVTENKEFHPENDSLGFKRDALKKKYNLFNTDGLKSIDEFFSVIKDAHSLLGGNDKSPDTSKEFKNPYSSSPTPKPSPNNKEEITFSPEEKKLMESSGYSVEQYLKIKTKHPDLVSDLLAHVRV